MARGVSPIQLPRIVTTMASAALGVIVVAGLYWAQPIFIPLALAIFLTFILAPVVNTLQRWHLGRTPSVILTVLLSGALLFGIGWVVTDQVRGLIESLKQEKYAAHIEGKVQAVRNWMQGGLMEDIQRFVRTVEQGTAPTDPPRDTPPDRLAPDAAAKSGAAKPGAPDRPGETQPAPVVVKPEPAFGLALLPEILGRAAEPLAQTALVFVLVIFMLARREDMRNRVIRLIGHGRLTLTTRAVDDAGRRVSRFLFVQMIVNATYGIVFGVALYLLRVDYAFLWGFLAAIMRYVPYLGIWVAVLPPVALSLAGSDGWSQALWVIGLVAVMEIVAANFAEPYLFGQSIGVSEVALLVSAAFWAWLWGPVGLVLSAPLTVCLVVLGKHVPQLEFFDTLLGDEPALPPRMVFYQRLLARDQDEAAAVVDEAAKFEPREQIFDDLLLPALSAARRDSDRGELADPDRQFIIDTVRELAEEMAEREPVPPPSEVGRPADGPRIHILGCPARDASDELALHMFRDLLDPIKWAVEVLTPASLSSELLEAVEEIRPAALCVAALPPGGLAHTRYLCKRLRQRFPEVKILVAFWGLAGDGETQRRALTEAGADATVTTLAAARAQLTEWLPTFQAAEAAPAKPKDRERVEQLA